MKPVLAVLFLALTAHTWADTPWLTPDSLAADFVLGLPAGEVPGQKPWPGVRFEYDFAPSPWGVELGYAYRGKQYYSYDHSNNQWSQPVPWELVDSGDVHEDDWPFYQTRHVISPGLVFRGDRSWVQPRLTLGLLVQFFLSAKADQYYPDYLDQFVAYQGTVKTVFGNSLKFGLEGDLWSWLEYAADFAFEVPDWSEFYTQVQEAPVVYAQNNAHFELRLGVRL